MKNLFFKRILISVLCFMFVILTIVIAAPTLTDTVKYQEKNTVSSFTADDFDNGYTDTKSMQSIQIIKLPQSGSLVFMDEAVKAEQIISADELSELRFIPPENFLGDAAISYKAYNGDEYSNQADLTIKYVENISDILPSVSSFSLDVTMNTPKHGKLECNYTGGGNVYFTVYENPKHGELKLTSTSGEFVYTPKNSYAGTDRFSFRAANGETESNIAVCSINVAENETDVPALGFVYQDTVNHWVNYSAVKMVERNVYKGERIGNKYYFRPDTLMTRIDVIEYILAALEITTDNIDSDNTHIFTDSPSLPEYINRTAYQAYKLGIIEGQSINGGLYLNPYSNITRSEIVKMIDIAMGAKTRSGAELKFADTGSIPDWSLQHFKNMIAYGIIQGYDDNTLRPHSEVTKAQATEMLYQMIKYNEENTPTLAQRALSGMYEKQKLV